MIKRITALLCTFACAFLMLAPVFSRKTSSDVVANAQVYEGNVNTFAIGLPTFNSLTFKGTDNTYYRPAPYVAIIGKHELTIAPSLDGFTPDNTVVKDWFIVPVDSQNYDFDFHVYGNNGFNLDFYNIVVNAYNDSFNVLTDDYLPYRLTSHYFFVEENSIKYIYCDYYVDYVNVGNESDIVRGAGFSLRIPVRDFKFNSAYKGYLGSGIPNDMLNVIDTTDVLGWSYSSAVGFEGAYDKGYNEGKTYGETLGYEKGYADGVANANEYTFKGLISSIIDVPVNAFRSLFNFDILGFNMESFFLSLLTLGAVLAIVRLIL